MPLGNNTFLFSISTIICMYYSNGAQLFLFQVGIFLVSSCDHDNASKWVLHVEDLSTGANLSGCIIRRSVY